ncbi:hypothetical protein CCACVL1_06873 [Corchorus capsularis]|uniref:Uncharacterized protein n=1 Tax=Corchorus capsularis TaxID=210143 RepID=A0A1R3JBZ0_COCAP|nr:hypothetical protein CCACVL1_06873 [Corchorus capsularis]
MATATVENGGIVQTDPDEAVKSGDQINDLMMLEENPDPKSRLKHAKKVLASLREDHWRVYERLRQREVESQVYKLSCLENREEEFRRMWIDRGEKLASLKRDLEKLTFANNAYKDRAIKSENKINNYNSHFRMHHGTNNMRNEKKVLKEINASCHKKGDDSTLSVDVISIHWGYHYPVNMVTDKAIANAPVKGKFWNSLPPKNVIKQEIKIMEKDSLDEDRKKHLRLKAKIEVLKQSISIEAKNDIDSLKRQLSHLETKKEEALKVVLDLINIRDQTMS